MGQISVEIAAQNGSVLSGNQQPDIRKLVELGVIAVNKGVADPAAVGKATVFLPGALTKGIEAADPMIDMRDAA